MFKDTEEYKEYFKYFGYDNTELYMQPTEKRAIDLLPTSGYKGFKSLYSLNIRKAQSHNNPLVNFNVGPLTAKLKNNIYQEVNELPEYKNFTNGQQKAVEKVSEFSIPQEPVKLPTCGYTGH